MKRMAFYTDPLLPAGRIRSARNAGVITAFQHKALFAERAKAVCILLNLATSMAWKKNRMSFMNFC